jgi:MFS family permease
VLVLSITLFLYSFGYGGITSFVALYADANGVVPKSIFFTAFALAILVTRPLSGRLSDRIGHRRVFLPVSASSSPAWPCSLSTAASAAHHRRHRVRHRPRQRVSGVRRPT